MTKPTDEHPATTPEKAATDDELAAGGFILAGAFLGTIGALGAETQGFRDLEFLAAATCLSAGFFGAVRKLASEFQEQKARLEQSPVTDATGTEPPGAPASTPPEEER